MAVPPQIMLAQSLSSWQRPSPQRGQPRMTGPPQSISVSPPLRTPSLQVASAQDPCTQLREAQSVPATQPWPVSQLGQPLPPQSTPVSVPFFMPSVQVGGLRVQTPATHCCDAHWSEVAQG